jgi:hypothetical protein
VICGKGCELLSQVPAAICRHTDSSPPAGTPGISRFVQNCTADERPAVFRSWHATKMTVSVSAYEISMLGVLLFGDPPSSVE